MRGSLAPPRPQTALRERKRPRSSLWVPPRARPGFSRGKLLPPPRRPARTRLARDGRSRPSPPPARGDPGPRLGVSPWALGHRLRGLKPEPGRIGTPSWAEEAASFGGGGGEGRARGGERGTRSAAGKRRAGRVFGARAGAGGPGLRGGPGRRGATYPRSALGGSHGK